MKLKERVWSTLWGLKLRRQLKKQQKQYKKEKARCAKTYPDWKDDEFNTLDLKFIWGILPKGSNEGTPSWNTLNDAVVYYNRQNKKYYFDFDCGFYHSGIPDSVARMIANLERVEEAFAAWLHENNNYIKPDGIVLEDFVLDVLCAEDLMLLRFKVGAMIECLKKYKDFLFDK